MTTLESPAAKPSWSDAIAVYLKPRVLIVILLGFSSGLDFETKIMVKEDAPRLLRTELSAPGCFQSPAN